MFWANNQYYKSNYRQHLDQVTLQMDYLKVKDTFINKINSQYMMDYGRMEKKWQGKINLKGYRSHWILVK
ncbi:unnamed protein product [Paramecium sonneborni]|uniref:Uncharacterized protein n=1 Tax=Paramecium sonneborni TaxID=65129 RepID=A0A8S1MBS3_9CILI|nr:unnamed protein product [Paramecium sonneborni]